MKLKVIFLMILAFSPELLAQSDIPSAPIKKETESKIRPGITGFKNINLGMSLQNVKEAHLCTLDHEPLYETTIYSRYHCDGVDFADICEPKSFVPKMGKTVIFEFLNSKLARIKLICGESIEEFKDSIAHLMMIYNRPVFSPSNEWLEAFDARKRTSLEFIWGGEPNDKDNMVISHLSRLSNNTFSNLVYFESPDANKMIMKELEKIDIKKILEKPTDSYCGSPQYSEDLRRRATDAVAYMRSMTCK